MDYDVLKTGIASAYKNYKVNKDKYNESMSDFYREGKKNPSVAKIMLKDYISKGQHAASKILAEVVVLQNPLLFDMQYGDGRLSLYGLSLQTTLNSLETEEVYKATLYTDNEVASQSKREFLESYNSKYPKTGELRNRIISANRISMDRVTPKASWKDKINFLKTTQEYERIYPKTFYTRYLLIANNHIKENEIAKRVGGMFRRLYYKWFIKGCFHFKK